MYGRDPLINLLKQKPQVLSLLGSIWDILYIEGKSPDVGKRRELVMRLILEAELGLKVTPAPDTERDWDFSVNIGGIERRYSLKTSEGITTIKVAWNGFPSIERARRFEFRYPILYVVRDEAEQRISVYVFELEDLEEVRRELGDSMWWIPRSNTNPRGFGLNKRAVEKLIEKAKRKNNFAEAHYQKINIDDEVKRRYLELWYKILKELVMEYANMERK